MFLCFLLATLSRAQATRGSFTGMDSSTQMIESNMQLTSLHPGGWPQRYDSGYQDYAYSVAADNGDVIVTGSCGGIYVYDYYTILYDDTGNFLWGRVYNGGKEDIARSVAVDRNYNIIVTGSTNGPGDPNYYTIKYDPGGIGIWSRLYDSDSSNSDDIAEGVAIDSNNNVVVTGFVWNGVSSLDFFTIKYNENGDTLWTRKYDGGKSDRAFDVAIDRDGNIVVTGETWVDSSYDCCIVKYASDGTELWSRTFGTPYFDAAHGVAVDGDNNIIVTGSLLNKAYCTVKYTPNGDTIWSRTYDGDSTDCALDVAVDRNNNIAVTGMSHNGVDFDYYTIKCNANGDTLWTRRYDSGNDDRASGIAIDWHGNIIVTGGSYNGISYDYYTIKYDSAGNEFGIEETSPHRPQYLSVCPNPFYTYTKTCSRTPQQITVYDLSGRLVENGESDFIGKELPSGIYFLKASGYRPVKIVKICH